MEHEKTKSQTIAFTVEGHTKVKEMSKRYGINQFMMMDVMIFSVDEQAKEFKERLEYWQDVKGAKKTINREMASAVNEISRGMSEEDFIALLAKAKELQDQEK